MTEQLINYSRAFSAQSQPTYAKNPLFQPDPDDVVRATLAAGVGDARLHGTAAFQQDVEAGAMLWERRHEDTLAPLLDSIRQNQGDPIYSAFSAQMNKLYQVFKELYDQDQVEIRQLLTTLESQKQQLQQLATENANVRQQMKREREQGAAALAAANAAAKAAGREAAAAQEAGRQQSRGQHRSSRGESPDSGPNSVPMQARASRQGDRGVSFRAMGRGAGSGGGRDAQDGSRAERRRQKPFVVLFLPYMLHPAHQCWRFYAAWQLSWTTRRTMWLAMAWILVFLLAVGLLVGLLVPWDKLSQTKFTAGPAVVGAGATQLTLLVQLNRGATLYYAVVPEAYTIGAEGSRRRMGAEDASSPVTADDGPDAGAKQDPAPVSGSSWPPKPGLRWLLLPGRWYRALWQQQHQQHPQQQQRALYRTPWQWGRGQLGRRRALKDQEGPPAPLQLSEVGRDDLRAVANGHTDTILYPYAVACGVLEVGKKRTNYTLTVSSLSAEALGNVSVSWGGGGAAGGALAPQECSSSYGLVLNGSLPVSIGPFKEGRCQRCPVLRPDTAYVVLLMGDGGRDTGVKWVRNKTLAA